MPGCSARIRCAARRPSSVWVGGMRTSTTATSGWCAPTLRSSSSASPAWPTTSKPDVLQQPCDSLAQQHRVLGDHDTHAVVTSVPAMAARFRGGRHTDGPPESAPGPAQGLRLTPAAGAGTTQRPSVGAGTHRSPKVRGQSDHLILHPRRGPGASLGGSAQPTRLDPAWEGLMNDRVTGHLRTLTPGTTTSRARSGAARCPNAPRHPDGTSWHPRGARVRDAARAIARRQPQARRPRRRRRRRPPLLPKTPPGPSRTMSEPARKSAGQAEKRDRIE